MIDCLADPLLLVISAGKFGHDLNRTSTMLAVGLLVDPPKCCLLVAETVFLFQDPRELTAGARDLRLARNT